ncbi:MAG: hypothetical protein JO120_03520 [Solirubrobacterales bacterium]|nr:hypothetical protein [Solirubrobacterales bacterium]
MGLTLSAAGDVGLVFSLRLLAGLRKRRWQRLSSVTRDLLAMSPDEHECLDFKENLNPLSADYPDKPSSGLAYRLTSTRFCIPTSRRCCRLTVFLADHEPLAELLEPQARNTRALISPRRVAVPEGGPRR